MKELRGEVSKQPFRPHSCLRKFCKSHKLQPDKPLSSPFHGFEIKVEEEGNKKGSNADSQDILIAPITPMSKPNVPADEVFSDKKPLKETDWMVDDFKPSSVANPVSDPIECIEQSNVAQIEVDVDEIGSNSSNKKISAPENDSFFEIGSDFSGDDKSPTDFMNVSGIEPFDSDEEAMDYNLFKGKDRERSVIEDNHSDESSVSVRVEKNFDQNQNWAEQFWSDKSFEEDCFDPDPGVFHRETKMTLTHMKQLRKQPANIYSCPICDRTIKGWNFSMIDHFRQFHFKGCRISRNDKDYYYENVDNFVIRRTKFEDENRV